jgi:hypothetical protein
MAFPSFFGRSLDSRKGEGRGRARPVFLLPFFLFLGLGNRKELQGKMKKEKKE